MNREKIDTLMRRLWRVVSGNMVRAINLNLWHRGLEVIQRKYGATIYLSKFEPAGMVEGESPEATITITPEPEWDTEVPIIRIANGGEGPDVRVNLPRERPRGCMEPEMP